LYKKIFTGKKRKEKMKKREREREREWKRRKRKRKKRKRKLIICSPVTNDYISLYVRKKISTTYNVPLFNNVNPRYHECGLNTHLILSPFFAFSLFPSLNVSLQIIITSTEHLYFRAKFKMTGIPALINSQ